MNITPERQGPAGSVVVGLLSSVQGNQVHLSLPDGRMRTFLVRPQDTQRVGLQHLASHAGFTDVGFRVEYETVDGKDYLLRATETAPPR